MYYRTKNMTVCICEQIAESAQSDGLRRSSLSNRLPSLPSVALLYIAPNHPNDTPEPLTLGVMVFKTHFVYTIYPLRVKKGNRRLRIYLLGSNSIGLHEIQRILTLRSSHAGEEIHACRCFQTNLISKLPTHISTGPSASRSQS